MQTICYAKLSIAYDLIQVQKELANVHQSLWNAHYNRHDYEGDWEILALRSPGGSDKMIAADLLGASGFFNTSLMEFFPSVSSLISSLHCQVMSARLLNLKAGARIKTHTDRDLSFEKGEARLHFPIHTNTEVAFYVEEKLVAMKEGDCWYINANRPHRVTNGGATDRIHLVIDCMVNEWLESVFEAGEKTFVQQHSGNNDLQKVIDELLLQNTETSRALAKQLQESSK